MLWYRYQTFGTGTRLLVPVPVCWYRARGACVICPPTDFQFPTSGFQLVRVRTNQMNTVTLQRQGDEVKLYFCMKMCLEDTEISGPFKF